MKFSRLAKISIILLFILGCESLGSSSNGTIFGKVTYSDGSPVQGATVSVRGAKGGSFEVTTKLDGTYRVEGLVSDTYTVTATKDIEVGSEEGPKTVRLSQSKVVKLGPSNFSWDKPEERVDLVVS